jgi:signal peptidase II
MRAVPVSRYLVFLLIAAGGLAADLVSKQWVFAWRELERLPEGTWWLWHDLAGIQKSLNPGALFGMGPGMWPMFSVLSVAAGVGILWWLFWRGAARQWILTIVLAGIMAGVLGNLYDRLGLHGLHGPDGNTLHVVRDWIRVMLGSYTWPNFNIADSLLVCGAITLVLHAFCVKESEPADAPAEEEGQPA